MPYLERERAAGRLRPGIDLARAADHVARMVLSLIGTPGRWDYADAGDLRVLVTEELLGPILVAET